MTAILVELYPKKDRRYIAAFTITAVLATVALFHLVVALPLVVTVTSTNDGVPPIQFWLFLSAAALLSVVAAKLHGQSFLQQRLSPATVQQRCDKYFLVAIGSIVCGVVIAFLDVLAGWWAAILVAGIGFCLSLGYHIALRLRR